MKKVEIKLNTINDVKNFVNITSPFDFDVDLVSGEFKTDAKSIMGIFSLDLAQPMTLEIDSDDCGEYLEKIKGYII